MCAARDPGLTDPAARAVDGRQGRRLAAVAAIALGYLLTVLTAPGMALDAAIGGGGLVVLAVNALRVWVVSAGWRASRRQGEAVPRLAEEQLPSYSVLVPLYRESNVVARLTGYLARLDYPPDRLEILLLCERDDTETIEEIRALGLDHPFRLVVCPLGEPRTKPRACNVGLGLATGEICVIFDAEDRPALDQLRRAASVFAVSMQHVVCLQARLDFHNHDHNWLARCFTVEYGALFGLVLPGLAAWDLLLPLGGTSNHFRTAALRELGGWDPYNVTEDADLGVRIHYAGWRTTMLDSTTLEEACAKPIPWVRQRTRWMKGYLQTWAAHARSQPPLRRSSLALHLVVGGAPVNAALLPALLLALVLMRESWWPGSRFAADLLAAVTTAILAVNFVVQILSGLFDTVARRRWWLVGAALSLPAYALMISLATYRSVWQLLRHPYLWEKTPHGLSGHDTDPAADH